MFHSNVWNLVRSVFNALNSKKTGKHLIIPNLTIEWSQNGGSHVGQKWTCWNTCIWNPYFSCRWNWQTCSPTDIILHLLIIKKKIVKFFLIGCVFYQVGNWGYLQINRHVSLHVGFKIQFAVIVPVFLEFNAPVTYCNICERIRNKELRCQEIITSSYEKIHIRQSYRVDGA